MADPVIGATVQVVLEKLLSLTIEEARRLRNCKKDLKMLADSVNMIKVFIHDAERRQVVDQAVKEWLMVLEGVAEDAENVFDEFRYESLKAQVQNSPMRKVSNFFSHTAFKCKMSRKIKNINEELRNINQSATGTLGLQSLIGPSQKILPTRETDSLVVPTDVVGRDNDVAQVKEKMLNMRGEVVPYAIPIVGMGGLGKTTIAKRIFNDEEIGKHFEKRVWLCLPEMSDTKIFLQQILESLTERKLEVQTRDIIVKKLRDELGEKRYLLVLDDLWRVDSPEWVNFKDSLRGVNSSRGNCILVTTRMEEVASTVAVDSHMLERLARDHCWSIFKQRAFVDEEVPEEILSMENRIVEMCQGLPLAASVLGGLFWKKEKHEWQAILDGNPLVAGEDDKGKIGIQKILKLSYDYLPSPFLKKCFAYFAMFPEDFKFEKDQLIQLWIAEGFLRPCQKTPVMEDVGNEYFQLLLQYSLLQDVELDKHNNIKSCKMHDLVHGLARDILKSKLFDQKSVGGENLSQVRYFGWDSQDQIDKINEPGRLRTLFWKSNISEDMLLSFKFLRVLNLSELGIEELSAKIGNLIYLRYLDLSYTNIKDLPNSICKLYNLQTIRFSLRRLPEEMANMISLRHIHWYWYYYPPSTIHMPLNMGQLTDLQTLPFFSVGLEKGRRIEELGHLKNLRGKLTINRLELVKNKEEAQTTYLREKSHIYKLAYMWYHDESEGCESNDEHVLDGLQPHPNLKMLEVHNYFGTIFPSWFSEELLPKLVKLKLIGCKRCKEIPSLGQLKKLVLKDMSSLIEWKGDEVKGRMFPRLEKLRITNCPLLKSVPSGENNLTSLESLELYNCDGLTSLPRGMLEQCRSLDFLKVSFCKNLVSLPLDVWEMPSLSYLNISECPKLISVPTGDLHRLTRLRVLKIGPFSETVDFEAFQLIFNGIQQLLSLRTLTVYGHGHWDSLPYQLMQIPALTDMEISDFGIEALPDRLGNLTSLERLYLRGCNRLQHVDFSDAMPKLRNLWINDCASLEALSDGLGKLVSLERLSLWYCKQLEHLPSRDAMRRLTKLCDLEINGCPKLEESCTNSQRSKISHIPNIEVNRRMIKGTHFI